MASCMKMEQRVVSWCATHHAELLTPYTSALRPVRLRCQVCATERTERASVLVEQAECPACPAWPTAFEGWVVERPYDLEGQWFLYGLDIDGVAVVVDVAPTADREHLVRTAGFRYVAADRALTAEELRTACLATPVTTHAVPSPDLEAPRPTSTPEPYTAASEYQASGQWMTRPRYGWRKAGKGKPFEHDPAEQATIAWLRAERAAHPDVSVSALCTRLEAHPEFPKRGQKRWHPTTVQRILEYNGIPVKPNYYA